MKSINLNHRSIETHNSLIAGFNHTWPNHPPFVWLDSILGLQINRYMKNQQVTNKWKELAGVFQSSHEHIIPSVCQPGQAPVHAIFVLLSAHGWRMSIRSELAHASNVQYLEAWSPKGLVKMLIYDTYLCICCILLHRKELFNLNQLHYPLKGE